MGTVPVLSAVSVGRVPGMLWLWRVCAVLAVVFVATIVVELISGWGASVDLRVPGGRVRPAGRGHVVTWLRRRTAAARRDES